MSTLDPSTVELTFSNGLRHLVPCLLAARVRGIDSDGDLLVPLCDQPTLVLRDDHSEYLVPLTPCCQATGKGAECSTGVVCRSCFEEVDTKYGVDGQVAAEVSLMSLVRSGPVAVRVDSGSANLAVVRPGGANAYVVTKEIQVGVRFTPNGGQGRKKFRQLLGVTSHSRLDWTSRAWSAAAHCCRR